LINFWATWCTPCVVELPELAQLQKQKEQRPFLILTINVGERKGRVHQSLKRMGLELPVLLDQSSNTFKKWGGRVLPTSLLIDSSGLLRYRAQGNPGWFDLSTDAILESLINQVENQTKAE